MFNLALIPMIVAGIFLLIINELTSNKKDRLKTMLRKVLWKIYSDPSQEELHKIKLWGWRKLILAGVMISSLITTLNIRLNIDESKAWTIGFVFFILWYILLIVVWYTLFKPSKKNSNSFEDQIKKSEVNEEKISEGWGQKVRNDYENDRRLPVTIITGFLGSGKTTLVKNILTNTIGMKVLVVENEIGVEGIDHELLMQHTVKEDIVLMNNGCVCCTVRQDLIKTFHRLFNDNTLSKLDWIVIETTGLADPGPLIQTLYMDYLCKSHMRLDSVLTVIDSKHITTHLNDYQLGLKGAHDNLIVPEAIQQISYADIIIMNKIDLISTLDLEKLILAVESINSNAVIHTCQYSNVSIANILNVKANDPLKYSGGTGTARTAKPLISTATNNNTFLKLDAKGKIATRQLAYSLAAGSNNLQVNTKAANGLSTISLVAKQRCLDLDLFNLFLSRLLKERGESLYRLKGILSMGGFEERFVAHGVHMVFDGVLGPRWAEGEERVSRLVLIGRGVDAAAAELEAQFTACLVGV